MVLLIRTAADRFIAVVLALMQETWVPIHTVSYTDKVTLGCEFPICFICSGEHPQEEGQGYGDWAGQNTDSQGQWEDKDAYKESAEEGYEEEEEEEEDDLEDEEEEYDEGEEMAESFFVDTVQPPQKKQKVGETRDKDRGS